LSRPRFELRISGIEALSLEGTYSAGFIFVKNMAIRNRNESVCAERNSCLPNEIRKFVTKLQLM
jgi:hypothetical protein